MSGGPRESEPQSWQRTNPGGPSVRGEGAGEHGFGKLKGRESSWTQASLSRAWNLGESICPSGVITQYPKEIEKMRKGVDTQEMSS